MKKVLVIVFCVIVCLAGLTYAYKTLNNSNPVDMNISTPQNTEQQNIQQNTEQTSAPKKDNDVTLTLKWKDIPYKKGTSVPMQYIVTNRGKNTIYHVLLDHPLFFKCHNEFGTLKPGETKKYTYYIYIATDSEVEEDMPGSGPIPNPWEIGYFSISFKDANGITHIVISNPIKIKVV